MAAIMRRQAGLSLIELMIASAIGLLLLTGLSLIFVNTSEANRELQKTAQQIENGRYAIEIISQDLRLAGFYGHLHDIVSITALGAPAAVPPNPCEGADTGELLKALVYPVHGYRGTIHSTTPASDAAADVSTTSCAVLDAANLKPGSDVLVIRRADTNALAATDVAASNVFYLQASATNAEVQVGNGAAVGQNKASGGASVLYLNNGATTPPAAPIRRLHTRIYFVAPCTIGAGAGGVCTGAEPVADRIPTLKRLELTSTGTFTIVPLVEGIDYLKVEYGIDDSPTAVNIVTGYAGDATVDRFEPAPSASEWPAVIAAKIYILARNTEVTRGYTDNKTYTLGSAAVPARNDSFKRHVYTAATHITNTAGRREIP